MPAQTWQYKRYPSYTSKQGLCPATAAACTAGRTQVCLSATSKQDLGSSIFVAKPASGLGPANPFASSSSSSNLSNPFSSGNPFANTLPLPQSLHSGRSLLRIPPLALPRHSPKRRGLMQTHLQRYRLRQPKVLQSHGLAPLPSLLPTLSTT